MMSSTTDFVKVTRDVGDTQCATSMLANSMCFEGVNPPNYNYLGEKRSDFTHYTTVTAYAHISCLLSIKGIDTRYKGKK